MKIEIPFYLVRNEEDIELLIVGNYEHGRPGRIHCEPENSYPPEPPEAEIERVLFNGEEWEGELTDREEKDAKIEMGDAACEKMEGKDRDPDDYYDSRYDD